MNRLSRLLILVPIILGLGACAHQRHRDQDRYGQYPAAVPAQGQQTQYGTVRSIEQAQAGAKQGSGGGALAGALIGGVVGNQMGSGNGRAAMTAIGVIGGAIAGDAIERDGSGGGHTVYRVRVRLDHGGEAQYDFRELDGLKVGGPSPPREWPPAPHLSGACQDSQGMAYNRPFCICKNWGKAQWL